MTKVEMLEAIITSLEGQERLAREYADDAQVRSGAEEAQWYWGVVEGVEKAIADVKLWRQSEVIRLP